MRARLSPLGAVRGAARLSGVSDPLAAYGAMRDALGDSAFAAAWELAGVVPAGELREAVLVLAGALLWNDARGSTRLPMGTEGAGPLRDALVALGVGPAQRHAVRSLILAEGKGGAAEALFGRPGEYKPFILDGEAVALERRARLEANLAKLLRERLLAPPLDYGPEAEPALRDVRERPSVSRGREIDLSAEQRWAVMAAAFQKLTVVSGGPGTGKTSIVVSMLRLLVRLGIAPATIALAAPTGKAANRMEEATARYLAGIARPGSADERLLAHPIASSTLHRLLGFSPRRGTFAHHAQNPLPHQVVIVDEASMIDVSLMDHLVRAVAPEGRLVLLGDAEQLPSVDAGAVLRDLVPANPVRSPRPWDSATPTSGTPGASSDLRDRAAIRLVHSYRMDEADPDGRAILLTSQAIRAGRLPELVRRASATEVLFQGAELLEATPSERAAFVARWHQTRFAEAPDFAELASRTYRVDAQGLLLEEDAARLSRLDRLLQSARVLCLYKSERDDGGVAWVNQAIAVAHAAILNDDLADRRDLLQPGTPLLMTQNDHALGLFNGDVGTVINVQGPDDDGPRVRLAFNVRGTYRMFDRGGLEARAEAAWAMTVHKAQGSELDHVALILPREEELDAAGEGRNLLSREVVYTAMTRARRSVTVVASGAVLREAVERTLPRYSGLSAESVWREE